MNRMVYRTPSFTWTQPKWTKKPYKYVHCTYICWNRKLCDLRLCEHKRDGNIFSQTRIHFHYLHFTCYMSRVESRESNDVRWAHSIRINERDNRKRKKLINLIIVGAFRLMQRPMIEILVFFMPKNWFLRNFGYYYYRKRYKYHAELNNLIKWPIYVVPKVKMTR